MHLYNEITFHVTEAYDPASYYGEETGKIDDRICVIDCHWPIEIDNILLLPRLVKKRMESFNSLTAKLRIINKISEVFIAKTDMSKSEKH